MTYEEFRQEMYEHRQHLIREAMGEKEMNLVWMNLHKLYLRLDENARSMADQVVCEWLLSDEMDVRGDAEYLIETCNIRSAKAGLEDLAHRLAMIAAPSAPVRWELEKVQQIVAKISA